jgi:carbon-monoxide dehydrogenase medium subunit
MQNFIGSRALPEMAYHRPRDLESLLDLAGTIDGELKFVAGCTDFIPALRSGKWAFDDGLHVVDVRGVPEMAGIRRDGEDLVIGAGTRLIDVADSDLVQAKAPALAEAVSQMASPQVRNIATIGGNLSTASPAADTAPPLLCLDAAVAIRGPGSRETVPLTRFFLGPGTTRMAPRELLTEIRFPVPKDNESAHRVRIGLRTAFVCSIISVAARLQWDGKAITAARIAMGAVAPTPVRLTEAEAFLVGTDGSPEVLAEAARLAAGAIAPISDLRASADYRRSMAETLTRRMLARCMAAF